MHHIPSKLFRQGLFVAALVLQFVLLAGPALAASTKSPAEDGYNPNVDGLIYTSVLEPDGSVIIGGKFANVQGVACTNLARILVNGVIDTSFLPSIDGTVTAIARQSNGSLLIAGDFTKVGSETHTHIARLSASGSVDSSFKAAVTQSVVPSTFRMKALALQRDGKILVGGHFNNFYVQGSTTAVVVKSNILRLNTDGTLDTSFTVSANDLVAAILVRPDNSIVFGGGFTAINSGTLDSATNLSIARLARVSATGVIDTAFKPTPDNRVNALVNAPDGDIYAGGLFLSMYPSNLSAARAVACLAKLNSDGTLDSTFSTSTNGEVLALALQPDGALLVGGKQSYLVYASDDDYTTATSSNIGRVTAAGLPDTEFYCGLEDSAVNTISVQGDGNIVLGGNFSRVSIPGDALATPRNHLVRLFPDGTPDSDFSSISTGTYSGMIKLANDAGYLAFGSFADVGGYTAQGIARITTAGVYDPSFKCVVDGIVSAAIVQTDGKIIIGGSFSLVNGASMPYIARLNADGSTDTTFTNPSFNGAVTALAVQADGQIICAGAFTYVGTTSHYYMARLSSTGVFDTTYVPKPSLAPSVMYVCSNGQLLVGGGFTFFNPNSGTTVYAPYLAKLEKDGTVDINFKSILSGTVYALDYNETTGVIYVGGSFNSLTWADDVDTTLSYSVAGLARLAKDGTLDKTFVVKTNNAVRSLVVKSDYIYFGGNFTTIGTGSIKTVTTSGVTTTTANDVTKYYLARVSPAGVLDSTWDPNPDAAVTSLYPMTASNRLLALGNFVSFSPDKVVSPVMASAVTILRTDSSAIDQSVFPPTAPASLAASGKVNFIVTQPNADLLVGGQFDGIKGSTNKNLMRLTPAGRVDASFSASTNGEVVAGVTLPMEITTLRSLNGYSALTADSSDVSVPIDSLPLVDGSVYKVLRLSDGSILLGGLFTVPELSTAENICRLVYDSSSKKYVLDKTFAVAFGGAIYSMIQHDDGKIYVGGSFTSVQANASMTYLCRLYPTGLIDVNFTPQFDSTVYDIQFSPDKTSLYAAGSFTTVYGTSTEALTAYYLARLSLTPLSTGKVGTLDTDFKPTPNGQINSLVVNSDGTMYAGGSFTSFYPNGNTSATTLRYIARIKKDGTLDESFKPVPNNAVAIVKVDADGKVLCGGNFTAFSPNDNDAATLTLRTYFARLNKDGTVDTTLDVKLNNSVTKIGLQSDGHIVISGAFTVANDTSVPYLARLTSLGVLDGNPFITPSAVVNDVCVNPDNSLIVGGTFYRARIYPTYCFAGSFTKLGKYPVNNIARVYIDGAVDQSFKPVLDAKVWALAYQPSSDIAGKMIVGGDFTKVTPSGSSTAVAKSYLVRFNQDGSIDSTFAASTAAPVRAIFTTPNGKLLVGTTGGSLSLFTADGVADSSFTQSVGAGDINSIGLTADGLLVVATTAAPFLTISYHPELLPVDSRPTTAPTIPTIGTLNGEVRSIAISAGGYISIAGSFTSVGSVPAPGYARFTSAGALDTSLIPNKINGAVTALALTEDGKTIMGGSFSKIDDLDRFQLARLAPYAAAVQRLVYSSDTSSLTWVRSGSLPLISRAYIQRTTDSGETWTNFGGDLTRSGSNWVLSGVSLDDTTSYFFRARGILPSAPFGSTGYVFKTIGGTKSQISDTSTLNGFTQQSATATSLNLGALVGFIPSSVSGLPAGLSYDPVTGIISGTTALVGKYTLTVTWFDGVTTHTGTLVFASTGKRIANFSIRSKVAAGETVVPGFIISGTAPKRVLIRAMGPTLGLVGVDSAECMQNPTFTLNRIDTKPIQAIASDVAAWGNDPTVASVTTGLGAFPFAADSKDCAIVVNLDPGSYTLTIKDANAKAGVVLAEVYDASTDIDTDATHMANISGRALTKVGFGNVTAGLILRNGPQRVLVRAVGPTLGSVYNVANAHSDPVLRIYKIAGSQNTQIAGNDNWATQTTYGTSTYVPLTVTELQAAAKKAYAADLDANDSKSAAILLDLPEGLYTAEADGATTGVILLEVFLVE